MSLDTIQTSDPILNRIQSNIRKALDAITSPFIGGKLISGINVSTGGLTVNHGLGRIPALWVLCDQQNNANVWRTAWDKNSITLVASGSCVVSIWVN